MDVGWSSTSSREKRKKSRRRRKGIEKMEKYNRTAERKNFISIFHIHFRDISIMDIFLMPRTCYMLMLMLFHLIFPFPIPLSLFSHSFPFLYICRHPPPSSSEYWNGTFFLNREWKNIMRGESYVAATDVVVVGWSSTAVYFSFFFDVSFVKKIVISISCFVFAIQRKKYIYWTNICMARYCDIVSCTVGE